MSTEDTTSYKYYPSVTNLMDLSDLPDFLSFLKEGINDVFSNKVFYQNYQSAISTDGSSASYKLDLIFLDNMSLGIPGTGINLVLGSSTSAADVTPFPITIYREWKILKYIRDFKFTDFSYQPEAFFNAALKIFGVSPQQILLFVMDNFVTPANATTTVFEQLLADLSSTYGTLNVNEYDDDCISKLVAAVEATNSDVSIFKALFSKYIATGTPDEMFQKINTLFSVYTTTDLKTYIKDLLIPKLDVSLSIPQVAIIFPESILKPVDPASTDTYEGKSKLAFNIGSISYSTENGLKFTNDAFASLTPSTIGNTGMIIDFKKAKLDLSTTSNIAEATAAGYPNDFVGVYVESAEITLPRDIFKNKMPNGQSLGIFGKNLLLGTGGISGTFGLSVVDSKGAPLTDTIADSSYLEFNLGSTSGFKVGFNKFDITLKQGEFVSSDIAGLITIPLLKDAVGEPLTIKIALAFDKDGDFKLTAIESNGIGGSLFGVVKAYLKSITLGKENNKFFVSASGTLDFSPIQIAGSSVVKDAINIDGLKFWDDGTLELKGLDGTFNLAKLETLILGPVKINITALHFGTYERTLGSTLRKYWYIGFDGGININPGGVDARGDGIKIYFTVDGGSMDIFLRIQSLNVDIIIPGNATKQSASVLINGYLSMKDVANNDGAVGSEYIGGVNVTLPKIGLTATSAMRLNPSVPAFLVDASLSLPMCIPLGSTGLGIYGFRGLLGHDYVATKSAAGVGENEPWYEYYKAKVPPTYTQGINVGKFSQEDGFSLGAGISLATSFDKGRVFSSKLFFLLALPDVFLLEGQANILSQRIDLDTTNDPPFYAMIAIDSRSVQAALGVNLELPSDSGFIATLSGTLEMGFFYGNAGGWYLNVGRDYPEEKRIRARIFTLFNAYFYFMISKQGIKAGAGAKWEFKRRLGPVKVAAGAYLDVAGHISFKPVQMGGSIALGGYASIKVFCFGFGISLDAGLAAEAPKPLILSGYLSLSFKLCWPFKRIRFTLDFTWTIVDEIDDSAIQVLDNASVKATHILTGEVFTLSSDENADLNNFVIPMDSYIDIEFSKGMGLTWNNNGCLSRIESYEQNTTYAEYVPPQRGKSPQLLHTFYLNNLNICTRKASGEWDPYDVYEALSPMVDLYQKYQTLLTADTSKLTFGAWQINDPGKNNKLRLLARTPLSYIGNADKLTPEELGYTNNFVSCGGTWREGRVVTFTNAKTTYFPQGQRVTHDDVIFRVTNADGTVGTFSRQFGLNKALTSASKIEIYFAESYPEVDLYLACTTDSVRISSYTRTLLPTRGFNKLPQYEYTELAQSPIVKTQAELKSKVVLNYAAQGATEEQIKYARENPIVKVVIEPLGQTSFQGILEEETTGFLLQETTGDILLEGTDIYQNQVQLFELNLISIEDFMWNNTSKDKQQVAATGDILKNGFNRYLQPIWRPDTDYRIQILATDEVTGDGHYNAPQQWYNFYFRTAGPVGHFHHFMVKNGDNETLRNQSDYQKLVNNKNENQFKLSTLKYYINMDRSYPNADGRLTNAKPLFYKNPTLNMIYNTDYVYTLFSSFNEYKGHGSVISTMEVLFKDPTEPTYTGGASKVGKIEWVQDSNCEQTNEVDMINNFIGDNSGWTENCVTLDKINKLSFSQRITSPDGYLDPDKLYTAQFNGVYKGAGINTTHREVIHTYTFKTSVYEDFTAQIQSFYSTAKTGNLYSMPKTFTAAALTDAIAIVTGSEDKKGSLVAQFNNKYDRLVIGALQLAPFATAQATEVTLVKHLTTGANNQTTERVVGLVVRNKEPFNDPKISDEVLNATAITMTSSNTADSFTVIHSQDRSAAFITNAAMNLVPATYSIKFNYIQFNGTSYQASVNPETIKFDYINQTIK
jgi:hypothetical protein